MTAVWEFVALLVLVAVCVAPVVRVRRTWSDAPESVRRFR